MVRVGGDHGQAGEQERQHGQGDRSSREEGRIHWPDRQHVEPQEDAPNGGVERYDGSIARSDGPGDPSDLGDPVQDVLTGLEIQQSFSYTRSGPVAPPYELKQYDEIVPGSAAKIIDASLHSVKVRDDAIERLTKAEAYSVTVAAFLAALLPYALVGAAVWLALTGHPEAAIWTAVGAGVSISPKLIDAIKGNNRQDEND